MRYHLETLAAGASWRRHADFFASPLAAIDHAENAEPEALVIRILDEAGTAVVLLYRGARQCAVPPLEP